MGEEERRTVQVRTQTRACPTPWSLAHPTTTTLPFEYTTHGDENINVERERELVRERDHVPVFAVEDGELAQDPGTA